MDFRYFLLVLIFINSGVCEEDLAEDTLVFVHMVVRHGARTPDPMGSYPSDIYKQFTFYPYGIGELNKIGRVQSYRVGKKLRQRYRNFLKEKYYTGMVDALSSGYSRCKMTMQLLLAGLFPPDERQTFQKGLKWQPILFKYNNVLTDKILTPFIQCFHILETVGLKRDMNVIKCNDTDFMYEYLSLHSGMKVDSPKLMMHVSDTSKAEFENNLKLPDWVELIYPEPLTTCANDFWRYILADEKILRLFGGRLMEKIYMDTVEIINSKNLNKKKMLLYTAHDMNIYVLLTMLNNWNNPSTYLATILFEVHKIDGVFGFKVYLDNQDNLGPKLLDIPGCGTFCSLNEFYDHVKSYFIPETC